MKCPRCGKELENSGHGRVSCPSCEFFHNASFVACLTMLADAGHGVSRWLKEVEGE